VVTSAKLYLAFLGLLALERGFELRLSARNARRAVAQGAAEVGARDYSWMVAVHATFLVACAAEVLLLGTSFHVPWGWIAFAGALGTQGLRYWAIAALGDRWNTRIFVVLGAPPIVRGPYRLLRHPNYVAVTLELLFVPLIHGAWLTALAFSLANAALLAVRIPKEERALGSEYARAFHGTPRFFPELHRDGSH
jgi:methyltransferase